MNNPEAKLAVGVWYYDTTRDSFFKSLVPFPVKPESVLIDGADTIAGTPPLIEVRRLNIYSGTLQVVPYLFRLAHVNPTRVAAVPFSLARDLDNDYAVAIFTENRQYHSRTITGILERALCIWVSEAHGGSRFYVD